MKKIGGPNSACCCGAPTCGATFTLCLTSGCCTPPAGATVTLKNSAGATIGTGTTASPFSPCASSAGSCGASIAYTATAGDTITWSFTCAYGSFSGTFTASCTNTSREFAVWSYASLPATLTLTDPIGNAITLTRASANSWTGSRVYSYTDLGGKPKTNTLRYLWGNAPQASCGNCSFTSYPTATVCDLQVAWQGGSCFDISDASAIGYALSASISDGITVSRQCAPPLYTYGFGIATEPSGTVSHACSAAPFTNGPFRGAGVRTFTVST